MIVRKALSGEEVPRIPTGPLAVHYCARRVGVTMRSYTTDPIVLADCVLRYYEALRPDAVWLSADTWVTAQSMGASVTFTSDDQPMSGVGGPWIRSATDVDSIPPPEPGSQGRWPLMLEALRRIRTGLGSDVMLVACFDQYPFSLACALMGLEETMQARRHSRFVLSSGCTLAVDTPERNVRAMLEEARAFRPVPNQ